MNQANGYWSSPDPYVGNQKAPKIEKFHELIWRKLRFFLAICINNSLLVLWNLFTYCISNVLTNFLVRTQKYLYFYYIIPLKKVIAIFRQIFWGHLVAELQQHRAQSYLDGWPFGPAIKKWTSIRKYFFSFFLRFLSISGFFK